MTGAKANQQAALQDWVRALELTAPIEANAARTLPCLIDTLGERFGDAPALLSSGQRLSYRGLAQQANRWARWALGVDLRQGDAVCLMLPNGPEYMAIWLGITRVGGVVALINTNLAGPALAHCIMAASPRHVIVAAELCPALGSARPHLAPDIQFWSRGANADGLPCVDRDIEQLSGDPLSPSQDRQVTLTDRALLIYTSGTTGLPKAACVSHARVMQWSHWFAGMMNTQPGDRMYNCLPMYHAIGGVVATGAVLVAGGSVVIAPRFSASRFWDEIVEWDCTLFQYIGELCRYLVNSPPVASETRHRLRLACGNGLAAGVWPAFEQRFHIPRILEYYAATEANFSLYNCEGQPGAIGRIPPFLAHRFPVALVRFDVAAGVALRDDDGLCIRCVADEAGEAISKIMGQGAGGGRFEGYTDRAASDAKVLRDVFAKGDAWYRTGDLMRRDAKGFFSFVERIGDTFRWKGENVSAAEVTAVIMECPGVNDAVVYGVAIAGADGRAGMAAIVDGDRFDLRHFCRHVSERLPAYARPVLVRLRAGIASTSTFRPVKHTLAVEGFDPLQVSDPLYVLDPGRQTYMRLDATLHAQLMAGDMRL